MTRTTDADRPPRKTAPRATLVRVRSFAPIADLDAEVLVLGSMPGEASLAAGQYYAHPRNGFWRIMSGLLGFEAALPYAARTRVLKDSRIALWDVLQSCARRGSLDAMIAVDTEIANDFGAFFRAHEHITRVYFNGARAESCFRRHVLGGVDARAMTLVRLPSTSPANAAIPFEQKLNAWRAVVLPAPGQRRNRVSATENPAR